MVSTTAVIGMSSRASQAPPHSQLPTWGRAMTTPRPSAMAARSSSSLSPSKRIEADRIGGEGQPRAIGPVAGVGPIAPPAPPAHQGRSGSTRRIPTPGPGACGARSWPGRRPTAPWCAHAPAAPGHRFGDMAHGRAQAPVGQILRLGAPRRRHVQTPPHGSGYAGRRPGRGPARRARRLRDPEPPIPLEDGRHGCARPMPVAGPAACGRSDCSATPGDGPASGPRGPLSCSDRPRGTAEPSRQVRQRDRPCPPARPRRGGGGHVLARTPGSTPSRSGRWR